MNTPNPAEMDLADALEQEPELAMLIAQPPIAYHRSFADLTGSVTAAVLLSACIEQHDTTLTSDGWFCASAQDLQARTGLSRKEQMTARKNLKNKNLIQERRNNFPATMEIRINFNQLWNGLLQAARQRSQEMRDRRNDLSAEPRLSH